ncbi:MAG TPA: GDSL-type esterase/lipase family protein [Vicinamibacterales bacterium]|nr:GDSL-type esterase/lipase family protein [Vicinamibacterales bacterium]
MRARVVWLFAVIVTVAFSEDCNSPSAPSASTTPPPVTRVSDPPAVTCPDNVSITAPTSGPAIVTYDAPPASAGEKPVSVSCTPESGAAFPVGSSGVECIATDALKRTATCSFSVFVAAAPRLSRTRILAFGDSITAGDVVVPGTDNVLLLPTAQPYPAVLQQLIRERYGDQPLVINAGLSGEHAFGSNTLPRFGLAYRVNNADSVVILEGFNDILYADPSQGISEAEIGVRVLAASARSQGARVFIALLTPTKAGRRQIPLGIVQAANDRLRQVARNEGAIVIDTFTPLLADLDGNIGSDGLHLTPLGYRRLGEAVFAAIRAELEVR